jgi:cyclopropane-fatty-acyl-phospholipid synthase
MPEECLAPAEYASAMPATQPPSALFSRGIPVRAFATRLESTPTSGTLSWTGGEIKVGKGAQTWRLEFNRDAEVERMTQLTLANDYLEGRVTASGSQRDILPLRHQLPYGLSTRVVASAFAEYPLAALSRHRRSLIEAHYDRPDAFFLAFLDASFQLYTQGHFDGPLDTDLETASKRKLARITAEFKKQDARRVLDIGCGWGGATAYLAADFEVTALTLGQRSYEFTRSRLDQANINATVHLCDVLRFEDSVPFDGVIILGVLEHLPNYRKLFKHLAKLTHKESRIYIDCSSSYSRLAMSPFIRQKIWPGTHGFVNVPALLKQAGQSGFRLLEAADETGDYAKTMSIWADRFVAHRDVLLDLVGQADYRAFEMYLFGGEQALRAGSLQAYHFILGKA